MRIEKMRGGKTINSKAILLVILVVVSLTVPLLAMSNTSQAKVYTNPSADDNIVVRGKDTAYSYNNYPPAPLKSYVPGDDPPMMMVNQIGKGRVVAFSDVTEYRMSPANENFVALTNAVFQWLTDNVKSPANINVEWFDGYNVYVTSSASKPTLDALRALGYTITGSTSTPINPAGNDILVLPEMQLGNASQGGDPTQLPDQDVANIYNFVQNGGGLLIMSGSDFFGPGGAQGKGNFYNVMNKVLENLSFGDGTNLFGFQGDSVYDDVYNSKSTTDVATLGGDIFRPIVDVNISHFIGQSYQAATGRTDFRAYGGCSLVQLGKGMSVYGIPTFRVGMPGDTLTYKFDIFNSGVPIPGTENVDLTIALTVTDNSGWGPTLDNSSIYLPQDNSYYVIVRVPIPDNALPSTEDKIVVTATADSITGNIVFTAEVGQVIIPTEDAFVDSVNPDTNFGDNTRLVVGRFYSASENTFYNAYLKFDLSSIPSDKPITAARLYLYCFHAYGSPQGMTTYAVDDDTWSESTITYSNAPAFGAALDTKTVSVGADSQPTPYSWDVTSYVQSQYAGDQVASFAVSRASDTPASAYRYFDSKEWYDNTKPMLVIFAGGPPVPRVSISPSSQSAAPGGSLSYTVTVVNTDTGSADTFTLATTDTAGWSPTVSPTSITVPAGENGTATLSVTVPSSAASGTSDSITVTATSQAHSTSGSASTTAVAQVTGSVEVTISPTSKSGAKGSAITYSVTVTNTGAASDTFSLTTSDTLGWGSTLSITSTTLAAGASRSGITLSITVPTSASVGDSSTITVKATGTGYDNTATSTATAEAAAGTSMLLYVVIVVVVIVIIAVVIIVLR